MLVIAHVDSEIGFSGGEAQVFLLMEGLRRAGHQNVLFCPPGSLCEAEARARGFETRCVTMANDLDLRAALQLRRGFAAQRPQLVHLHTGRANWLGGLAARAVGAPAITTRRMDRQVKRGWRTRLIYHHLVRRAAAISPAVARLLAEGGVPREIIVTIPSSVDPEELRAKRGQAEIRAELGVASDELLLLCLAALVPRKGLDVLIDALARLQGARGVSVRVAGDGPERGALEALVRSRGLEARVHFLGARRDKAELLAACDVLVLPSRREGLGVASLEAMAAGRAVLATRVGGLAEAVVNERTGLLVEPEDPEALAGAIARLRDEPGLVHRLGRAGPGRVAEGFLADQMVAAYERLYDEVLSESVSSG
ncbi:MAG: glycosyltransferase [Myxococcota bacterium]